MRLPSSLRTTSFRLTLAYGGVFAVSAVVLLVLVSRLATGFMVRQIDITVANDLAELWANAAAPGASSLREAVTQVAQRAPGEYYLLQDARGNVIAGNLPAMRPAVGIASAPWPHPHDNAPRGGIRGRGVVLADGSYLFVGLSDFELGDMNSAITRAVLVGLAVTLVIALAGGLAVTLSLLRRIDRITLATREIMAGDLNRRIPLGGTADEFERLAAALNAMLDRIQSLMRGLQQVSEDIAHDLRTPLTRLRQGLELARRRAGSVPELRTAIDGAISESEATLATFSALLRIAQVEAGTRRSGFTRVLLHEVLTDLAEAYRPALEEKHQALLLRARALPAIHGDRALLTQLFANLIENGLVHCPPGTVVVIEASATAKGVCVVVSDDGPGIPEALRARVLQRLYKLDRSRSTGGSGLGLSLAQAVATLHGATLVLHDNRPGLRCEIVFAEHDAAVLKGVPPAASGRRDDPDGRVRPGRQAALRKPAAEGREAGLRG